jgi:quercetin dioxygenase-like cupin family protein
MTRRGDDEMAGKKKEAFAVATVAPLAGLVEYQDDTIVSRQILDKSAGSVTLFAFAEGEGLREHSTPYDALIVVLDGEVDITISGTVYRLKAGETIVMPADKPHAVKSVTRFKMMLVMIRSA